METQMPKNLLRAKYVKKEREERAWPQRQLADVADVNLRTIQRLEKDGAASFETLMAVAQAFGIDVKELSPSSKKSETANPPKKIHHLPRLVSGRDFFNIVNGSDHFQVEHDDADDIMAQNAMVGVVNGIKRDIVQWHDADLEGKMKFELLLTKDIKDLENHGFYLFGTKRTIPKMNGKQKTSVSVCTIYMSHARSPKIISDKNLHMVVPALLTETMN